MKKAVIYIVPTPIGNLSEITPRAIKILNNVDRIYCENTKKSSILTKKNKISTPLYSYHKFNDNDLSSKIIDNLEKTGNEIALISDAGTPGISDPGYSLVKAAIASKIRVIPVSGPCALISSLVSSGLPTNTFSFFGFLPSQKEAVKKVLESKKESEETLIFYESKHRIINTLQLMNTVFKSRKYAVSRELTKEHETIYYSTFSPKEQFDKILPKGEFVICIEGKKQVKKTEFSNVIKSTIKILYQENMPLTSITKVVNKIFKYPRKEIYDFLMEIKGKD